MITCLTSNFELLTPTELIATTPNVPNTPPESGSQITLLICKRVLLAHGPDMGESDIVFPRKLLRYGLRVS